MKHSEMTVIQKWTYYICLICLSLYIGYIIWFNRSCPFENSFIMSLMVWFIISGLVGAGLEGMYRIPIILKSKTPNKCSLKMVFVSAFFIALLIYGITLMACWPGAVTYDASNQWHQVHTGEFNNWHPLFHTLLIWLTSRIYDNYSFCLIVQIIVFSFVQAALITEIRKTGVPSWVLLCVHSAVCLTPAVRNVLMCLGKDSAMTIGYMFISVMLVRILNNVSEGKKEINGLNASVLMGMALCFTTLVRHNALLITFPVCVVLILICKKSRGIATLAVSIGVGLIIILKGPVFGMLDVVYPSNFLEESIGIPMTAVCDIYTTDEEKTDKGTKDFLLSLMSEKEWKDNYIQHSYNSVKFLFDRELIAKHNASELFDILIRTIIRAPQTAFDSMNAVTDLVWSIEGKNEAIVTADNSGNIESVRYGSARINGIGNQMNSLIGLPSRSVVFRYLTENIGVQFLLLLICTLGAIRKKGPEAIVMGIPMLAYNLGTMFLLCGNDVRFFQFTLAAAFPLSIFLFWWTNEKTV